MGKWKSYPWRELFLIALALSLAWGLRGQHGHERGAAIAGAMAGLVLAAVTGGPRWIGAAVIGSIGFAIGGSLSYGRFVPLAYQGDLEAILALGAIGFAWGGLGSLCLGLGLALPRYRFWERVAIGGGLFLVWFLVDRLLWFRLSGPQDLGTRELMAVILLSVWALLCAYVGVWRRDWMSLKLALAGAIGFGLGFPMAAWIQGVGGHTGLPIDWWKVAEHTIGLCGGVSLGLAALSLGPTWTLPQPVNPWERWMAVIWLLWLLPSWLIANNLDFWIWEKAVLPTWVGTAIWAFLFFALAALAWWGWMEIRRGRIFVTSWLPHQLQSIFLTFLWLSTGIAAAKSLVAGEWSFTPLLFLLLASLATFTLRWGRACAP